MQIATHIETFVSIIASIIIIGGTIYRYWNKCKSLDGFLREFNITNRRALTLLLEKNRKSQFLTNGGNGFYTFKELETIFNDRETNGMIQMQHPLIYLKIKEIVSKGEGCKPFTFIKRRPSYFSPHD